MSYEFDGRAIPTKLAGWTTFNILTRLDQEGMPDTEDRAAMERLLRGAARQSELPEDTWVDHVEDMQAFVNHLNERFTSLGYLGTKQGVS
jgi:hypothetical protein